MFLTNIVLSLLAIALLVRVRGEFFGRAKRGSAHQAASAFVLIVSVSVGVGYGLVTLFPGSLHDPWERLTWTLERVLGGAV